MEEVCRLCFGIDLVNIPIFGEDDGIYKKVIACLPIKLRDLDSLPKKICNPCNEKIEEFYSFREKTLETENKLYMLTQIKSLEDTGELSILKTDSIADERYLRTFSNSTKSTQTDDVITDLLSVEIKTETLSICSDNNDHFDDALSNADFKDDKELGMEREETEVKEKKRRRYKKAKKKAHPEDDVALISLKGPVAAEESPSPEDMSLSNFIAERMKAGSDTETWIKKEELDDDDGEAYCCCVCYEFLFSKNEMLTHYRTHKHESEKRFEEDLRSGKCEPNGDGQYQCILCKNTFEEIANLVNHVTIHRAGKPYRCTLCEKTFSEAMHILKHGKTHVYENCTIESCPTAHLGLCPKEHRMISKAIPKPVKKRYVCDMCTEEFVYMRYLKSHRTLEHPEAKDRQFVNRCMHCFREFSHINSLRRHLRSHSGERNFLCYVCGKALSSREHLKFHISIHTGHKPHICKTCGKAFVKKCNLTLHERVHSGERPHVCTHCGKAFSQRSTLVIHERYHSGARPYVCGLCKKGFVAKGLLSMHLKTTCI